MIICDAAMQVPVWLLKATRGILKSFQWARDAADRLVRTGPPLKICCLASTAAHMMLQSS